MASLREMSFSDAIDAHLVLDAFEDAEYLAQKKAEDEAKKR